MSRELRDKAEIMMRELKEMLVPLKEEINKLRRDSHSGSADSTRNITRRG
jgi:hypothetical protein